MRTCHVCCCRRGEGSNDEDFTGDLSSKIGGTYEKVSAKCVKISKISSGNIVVESLINSHDNVYAVRSNEDNNEKRPSYMRQKENFTDDDTCGAAQQSSANKPKNKTEMVTINMVSG